jgi:hypothetical protein
VGLGLELRASCLQSRYFILEPYLQSSSTILSRSDKSEHPCLGILKEKFSTLCN